MRLVAYVVAPLLLPVVVVLFVGACIAVPGGVEAARLLYAQDDPVRLADYAVEKSLSPEVARAEIEHALAADDADLAASFLALAHDRDIAVDPALAARVEAAGRPAAQAVHTAKSFAMASLPARPMISRASRGRRRATSSYSATSAMPCARAPMSCAVNPRTN